MMRLAIALGGVAGALARYGAGAIAALSFGPAFPWGTLAVNVAGACALGVLMRLLPDTSVSPATRAALTVGFCGGFTTFSTFALEAVALGQTRLPLASAYILASVVLSLAGVAAGMGASAFFVRRRSRVPRTTIPIGADDVPPGRFHRQPQPTAPRTSGAGAVHHRSAGDAPGAAPTRDEESGP